MSARGHGRHSVFPVATPPVLPSLLTLAGSAGPVSPAQQALGVVPRPLAETIADVVGYEAELTFDATKPDGTPRKLMDSSNLHALGWNKARSLRDGIAQTYDHWLSHEQG